MNDHVTVHSACIQTETISSNFILGFFNSTVLPGAQGGTRRSQCLSSQHLHGVDNFLAYNTLCHQLCSFAEYSRASEHPSDDLLDLRSSHNSSSALPPLFFQMAVG